jgi:hypothetical protein
MRLAGIRAGDIVRVDDGLPYFATYEEHEYNAPPYLLISTPIDVY